MSHEATTPASASQLSPALPASSSSSTDRTFRPYGYGQVFPSFSPRSSGAGDTDLDWTMAEEKILMDVAQWLSPADLRRARLVCKTWYSALATLTTKATTPAETLVPQWTGQLEAMLQAFPCLQQLTISSKLSSAAAQQLGVLATAKQLQVLNIPQAQALQDRSLLALQPLASHLRQLRINGALSLSRRSLLLLSALANLEVLELKNCGKISWAELQQAWRAACVAYELQAAAEGSGAGTNTNSSGGGSGRFSSSGGGLGSKLGAWLPTGRLFRTSSPSSNSIQSALAWQRTGTSSLFAKVHDIARGTSAAAAVAVAQLGIGAVGNGRSSCGGSMPEAPARSLLYKKQKEGAAAAASSSRLMPHENALPEADPIEFTEAGGGCFPVRSSLLRMRSRSAISATAAAAAVDEGSPRPVSMLSRVGSLVWHNSSAASAGTSSSSETAMGSGSSSFAAQTSCVQAALLAFIAQEEKAAAATEAETEFLPGPNSPVRVPGRNRQAAPAPDKTPAAPNSSGSSTAGGSSNGASTAGSGGGNSIRGSGSGSGAAASSKVGGAADSTAAAPSSGGGNSSSIKPGSDPYAAATAAAGSPGQQISKPPVVSIPEPAPQYKRRRRTTGDRALPAMPFTKLASLSFTCTEATLKNPGPELAAIAALTSLTALEVSKCKLPDSVFEHLQSLRRLSKLKLTGLWSMGDAGLQHVAQLTTLHSLALSEAMHVTARGLQALSSLSGLTSLALGFTQDLGPGGLAQVVNSLPLLQCVKIAAPSWGDLDCEMLAEASPAATPAAAGSMTVAGSASTTEEAAAARSGPSGGAEGSTGGAAAAAPQMFWDLAGSFSTGNGRGHSRSSSSMRAVLPLAMRGNSSWSLRGPSPSSMRDSSFSSRSFGSFQSFSVAASSQMAGFPAALPAQPLLVLRLHGCRGLTSKGMAALKQLHSLHTLLLEDCKEVRAAEVISQGLLPPKLAALTLRNLPFGNLFSGCVSVPCCSTRLRKLELLSLEGAHEGQLRRLLGFFPNVEDLSLSGCAELGDAAMQHLAVLSGLQQLNMGGCGVVGHGLEHLQVLPKLRVLSLKACGQLTDAGLAHLPSLPTLEELDVSECGGVSEQGLLCVAQGAARLVRMDVTGCRAVGRGFLASCPHYLSIRHSC